MPTLDDIASKIETEFGEGVGVYGGHVEDVIRIPTGIFALDLAIGGGIPRGRVTEIYGPEGSCKTNLALKAVANAQRLWPDQKAVFIDVEGTFDPKWASLIGVDTKKVYVLRPDYAEHVSDIMFDLMSATDVSIIVLDSLAAIASTKEAEQTADKATMADSTKVIKGMVNRITPPLKKMRVGEVAGMAPAIIWINQTRMKIGVVYGNPETTPGGQSPKFMYSLRLRVSGKPNFDKEISAVLPITRTLSVSLIKWKVMVTAQHCEFDLAMIPHKDLRIGEADEWNLVEQLLKNATLLEKSKKGWTLADEEYPTLKAIRARYRTDKDFAEAIQENIIARAVAESGFTQETDTDPVKFDPKTGEVLE